VYKDPDKKRDSVNRWYYRHRDEFNAKRRIKYAANAELRERYQIRARTQRVAQSENGPQGRTLLRDLGDGIKVEVHTVGMVAKSIGVTPQTLRRWESNGWIPECVFPSTHRLYTNTQLALLKEFKKEVAKTGDVEATANNWAKKWVNLW
jgi:hypothetical protein